jgi:hypothetical protein
MNVSLKFATGLVLAAGLFVAAGTAARAGEGGAAGSVSIRFGAPTVIPGPPSVSIPNVDRLSSSVAVGKGFAAATALTGTGTTAATTGTSTSAIGAGGGFTLTDANSASAAYVGVAETAAAQVVNQANSFVGGTPASLRPGTGVILP